MAALFSSPSTTALCSGAVGPSRKPSTRHTSAGGVSSASTARRPARFERWRPSRSIWLGGTDAHDDALGAAQDGPKERFALGLAALLRVVQAGERADGVVVQPRVVEQDACDDERAGERAAPRLVGARDEARAELAVVLEELPAGATSHCREDSAALSGRPAL